MNTEFRADRLIEDTRSRIVPSGAAVPAAAFARQSNLTKPPGSLGRLEELSVEIAAMTNSTRPRLVERLVVVAAGDHGVTRQGVHWSCRRLRRERASLLPPGLEGRLQFQTLIIAEHGQSNLDPNIVLIDLGGEITDIQNRAPLD
jgi:NaMN:DMB phosphoribosyltransferase